MPYLETSKEAPQARKSVPINYQESDEEEYEPE